MKKTLKFLTAGVLTGTLLVGCSPKEESKPIDKQTPVTEAKEVKPELKNVAFVQEGNKVTINFEVENMTFSEEHYGGEHVEGEGHAHIYVDGNKYSGIKHQEPGVVENLEPGKHIIQLQLQKNNHGDYGTFIEKEITVE